jgi:hypothetical protein
MHCWQVRAECVTGALFTCGLQAADGDQAFTMALRRIPFDPCILTVTAIRHG